MLRSIPDKQLTRKIKYLTSYCIKFASVVLFSIITFSLKGEKEGKWEITYMAPGGEYLLSSTDSTQMTMELKGTGAKLQGVLTLNRKAMDSEALMLRCKSVGKTPATFNVILSWRDSSGKLNKANISGGDIPKSDFEDYVVPLKEFLKGKANEVELWQIKIGVNIKKAKINEEIKVEFKDIAIADPTKFLAVQPGVIVLKATPLKAVKRMPVKQDWTISHFYEGADHKLTSISPEEFVLTLTRNNKKARASAQADLVMNLSLHTQNLLSFQCRTLNDHEATIMVNIVIIGNSGKAKMCFGPWFKIKGKNFRTFHVSFDQDMKLGDCQFILKSIKLSAEICGVKPGESEIIEFRNIRVHSPEELGALDKKDKIIVYPPANRKKPIQPRADALKVFFKLDNDDYAVWFGGRGSHPKYHDNCQYPGFRERLLELVSKDVVIVRDIKDADVIVYSCARKDTEIAKKIASSVKNGAGLLAFGNIADPEVAELLPVNIYKIEYEGLPERAKMRIKKDPANLFFKLNPASFGVYSKATIKPENSVYLTYANGNVAIARGSAGKGKIIYSSIGLGSDLIVGSNFRDAFFIRALGFLSGKKFEEIPQKTIPYKNGFLTGFGENNFGRFGYALGDGLLVESINKNLDVINGVQEYNLSSAVLPRIPIPEWSAKALGTAPPIPDGKLSYPAYYWQIGKYELLAKVSIPEKWKDKILAFIVEGGIDDTADIYLNGHLIGRVTESMPEYWIRRHHHVIPAKFVKYGEENTLKIITENLRGTGGFNTCPNISAYDGPTAVSKFVPDRINALGKGGVLTEHQGASRRFDSSLAFPGIRWEVYSNSIDIGLIDIAAFAAYKNKNGIQIVDMKKIQEMPTDLTEPWILLFNKSKGRPLLLTLGKKPERILINKAGEIINGLTLKNSGEVGMILPVWINGTQIADSGSWTKELPKEVLSKIHYWIPKAFSFPIDVNETFKIDSQAKKVIIRSCYKYKFTPNEWGVKPVKYAPVSPLAFLTDGILFESKQAKACESGLITNFGPYALNPDSDTVEWSLPLPEPDLSIIPAIDTYPAIMRDANSIFSDAVQFVAGGATKSSDWTFAYPTGIKFPSCKNISLHGWLHGINQALTAPFALNQENFQKLMKRAGRRMIEPLDRYQYKAVYRWREEPFSGIRYPIFFNCRHTHGTKFAEGFGSVMNYGDQNETIHMILSILQYLADHHGQTDLIKTNATFIRETAKLLFVSDDWAYMACHCRESGQNVSVDMLNCEYSSMMKLARLAEILEDDSLRKQALYRGARRLVPTLARFDFLPYVSKNKLRNDVEKWLCCTGFSENGGIYMSLGSSPGAWYLYDMSQGVPNDIVPLYKRYLNGKQQTFFEHNILAYYRNPANKCKARPQTLMIAALDAKMPKQELRTLLVKYMRNNSARLHKQALHDWPGMTLVNCLSQITCALDGKVKAAIAKGLDIRNFSYDIKNKKLTIDLTAASESRLILKSRLLPVDSDLQNVGGYISVPLPSGRFRKTLEFKEPTARQ